MDKEKICEVLNEIKRYCDNRDSCRGCIFNDPEYPSACPLDDMPERWPTFKVKDEKGVLYL